MPSTTTQDEHLGKRRKLDSTNYARHTHDRTRPATERTSLSCSDYTVGWICALPVELAAAKAMLDVEHATIPTNDENVYSLGSICEHNVVIACLPIGCYGTTAAAVVADHMMSTFESIRISLLVGIAGGAPRPGYDIRLGDVVISTPTSEHPAVVQYDFGKTGINGTSEPKGTLNKPKPQLLRAVARMKANRMVDSKVAEYISSALDHRSLDRHAYAYPGVNSDILLRSDYEQDYSDGPSAREAVQIRREPRSNTHPTIFYGTIGSGNQVIKDVFTRDRLAIKLNALCFEMEAAGLMDEHQCLVIRGISDYCDAHKNKDFQGYAAIAAAAAAKELLSIVPRKRTIPIEIAQPNSEIMYHRQALMEALDFEDSDTRRATVKRAHTQTCKWLLEQPDYLAWHDSGKFSEHHGLLWIKGKPGTGKSTIMKFVLEQMQKQKQRDTNLVIISFFFNARGHDLEKSTVGMYRSLLYQMLKAVPGMQILLDDLRPNTVSSITSEHLENLLTSALELLGSSHLICFVDALDECPEDQIRRMVQFFEEIGERTCSENLHVLFASRHYPNISTEKGQVLVLEEQDGHSQDLVKYVNAELKIGKGKQSDGIKEDLLRKSGKIFLWVVLVVRILRAEYDKGRIQGLAKKLQEIPLELDELFRDILMRDGQRLPELVLCMQWILYAARPLSREEFYFALLTGNDSEDIPLWDSEYATTDVMDNLLLDTSKGLAEMTRAKKPTVQFIHESVREFLLKPRALADLHHGFQGLSTGQSHQRLRECCERQIYSPAVAEYDLPEQLPAAPSPEAIELRDQVHKSHPFLSYAAEFVVRHANSADRAGISQLYYSETFIQSPWLKWYNVLQKYEIRRFDAASDSGLIVFLATQNLERLLALKLQPYPDSSGLVRDALNALYKHKKLPRTTKMTASILLCRIFHGYSDSTENEHENFIELLLDLFFATRKFSGINPELRRWNPFVIILRWHQPPALPMLDQALRFAAYNGSRELVALLCSKGAIIDSQDSRARTPLSWAAARGHVTVVEHLCSKGAIIDSQDSQTRTPLSWAAAGGHVTVVEHLCSKGAIVDSQDSRARTPLLYAVDGGSATVVEYLCSGGATVDAQDKDMRTPLHILCLKRVVFSDYSDHILIVKSLLHRGAEVNRIDVQGYTPLQYAVLNGAKKLSVVLYDHGADATYLSISAPLSLALTDVVQDLIQELQQSERRNPCCEMAMAAEEGGGTT